MKLRIAARRFLSSLTLCGALLSACTQLPTEKQGISDMRPQISFQILSEELRAARVQVDGLDMGPVGDFREGVASLRILPGSHQISVSLNGRVMLDERLYVGSGVNRTLLVK